MNDADRDLELIRQHEKRVREKNLENDFSASQSRARSVTVGTAFGGTTEISMRKSDGMTVWALFQPVEVVELIHQLAANIGCHIALKPRDDFSSWRSWRVTEEEKKHLNGHPPFVSDMGPHETRGRVLPKPEQQPGLQPAMMARSKENEQTVADQKPVKRRSTKRAATPA